MALFLIIKRHGYCIGHTNPPSLGSSMCILYLILQIKADSVPSEAFDPCVVKPASFVLHSHFSHQLKITRVDMQRDRKATFTYKRRASP